MKATEKFLEGLETLLRDENESEVVRTAALEGLSVSDSKESVDALVRFLDSGENLREELVNAMAAKTDKKSVAALVEHFKDSEAILRDRISGVFVRMGESGEESLIELIREDIPSLKPFLADILTRTGFVELLIRRLNHRKPKIRRDAAELLAEIATESAYRGIVLAARDPDRDVRIKVTKALESLATPEGEGILKSLERIRIEKSGDIRAGPWKD
jgi:HEAT repeat protein